MDYVCNYSSSYDNAGVGYFMEIYNSNSITIVSNVKQTFWTKQYSNWYSESSNAYYNYYWNPYSFIKLNSNAKPIPTKPKWRNITNTRTKPNYGHVPTTHIVKK
jgi:hypothetical protein